METNLMYNQSDKKITQEHDEATFQTGIILSLGKLDIKFLVLQHRKHEAYSSQRMERIQVIPRYKTNSAKSGILRAKRWQNRNRLETLERQSHALDNFL